MMVELLPPADSVGNKAIEGVLTALAEEKVELPARVFVADGDDSWRRHAARLPVEDRRRSVVAAIDEESMVEAVRFEIGGAAWLPISTPAMESASASAVAGVQPNRAPLATRGILETVVDNATELLVVGWRPQSFWNRQVGSIRLCSLLTAIAECLDCVPAILPGPVLVVADRDQAEIEACSAQSASALAAQPTILGVAAPLGGDGEGVRIDDLLAATVDEGGGEVERIGNTLPVLEMPSGRQVGRWAVSIAIAADGPGWLAVPEEGCRDGDRWQLIEEDGIRIMVVDSVSPTDRGDGERAVIRVPGWIGAEVRRGSPAGLLVDRLARHEGRGDRPLWVPSADAEAVQFLLGLPGPIWVDGPGVPS